MGISLTGQWPLLSSGDPHAAQVQLHGSRLGKKRSDSSPGRLLPRGRWQQHLAQLLWERRHHPAGARGPGRLALRGEREDQDVRALHDSSQIWCHVGSFNEENFLLCLFLSILKAGLVPFLLHSGDHRWRSWLHEAAPSTKVGLLLVLRLFVFVMWRFTYLEPCEDFFGLGNFYLEILAVRSEIHTQNDVLFIVRSLHGKSSSTGNLLEREDMPVSAPDYGIHSRMAAHSTATLHRQQRPYSMAGPGFPQVSSPQCQYLSKICQSVARMRRVCLCRGGRALFWRECLFLSVAGITSATLSLCNHANQFPSASHSPAQGCVNK